MILLWETRYRFSAAPAPMPKRLVLPVPVSSSFDTKRRPTGAGKDMFYDHRSIGKGVFASQTPFGGSPGEGSGPGTQSPEPSAHSGRGDLGGSLAQHEGNDAGRDPGLPFQPGEATKLTQERSVPTNRGAPPLSRRAHLLTTGPEGRWWYPSRWSGRALLTETPPGLPPEGPAMPQVVIAGAVGSAALWHRSMFRFGTYQAPTAYAPLYASHLLFSEKEAKNVGLRAGKGE